jgi:hypothetical protein
MYNFIDCVVRYTVRHASTLKWLPVVFVRPIQSQRIITVMAKYSMRGYEFGVFLPTHTKSARYKYLSSVDVRYQIINVQVHDIF